MQGTSLAPEVVVAGRYRLIESLARGGTASVWRAHDAERDCDVAIKVLRDDDVDPALRSRAEREASVLTGISHPNLVEVLDSGDDDGRPYIVMALLEGDTLTRIIRDRAPLPVDEAATLIADVADGLGAVHAKGVIHRDVKPGNIVCHQQVPTLVDFGIARAVDATTLTRGLVLGTASYLAPEQAQGLALTPAADVYSLACVLYELLTGRAPFTGDSPVVVAMKHVQEDPVPPGDLEVVPPAIDEVVLRALSKDPALRPADGAAFAAALRTALDGDHGEETIAIAAPPVNGTMVLPTVTAAAPPPDAALVDPSPLVPPPPRRRRHVPVAALVVAGLVAAVLLLALAASRDRLHVRPVPNVTNASVADATRYLEGAGFDVDVKNVPSPAASGTVVASDPSAGTKAPEGSTIELSVASSTPTTTPTSTTTAPAVSVRVGGKHRGKKGD
jgi:serine/threonine-protein kinase